MKQILLITTAIIVQMSTAFCSAKIEEADFELDPECMIKTASSADDKDKSEQPQPFESKILASRPHIITGYNYNKGEGLAYQINTLETENLTSNVDIK